MMISLDIFVSGYSTSFKLQNMLLKYYMIILRHTVYTKLVKRDQAVIIFRAQLLIISCIGLV